MIQRLLLIAFASISLGCSSPSPSGEFVYIPRKPDLEFFDSIGATANPENQQVRIRVYVADQSWVLFPSDDLSGSCKVLGSSEWECNISDYYGPDQTVRAEGREVVYFIN